MLGKTLLILVASGTVFGLFAPAALAAFPSLVPEVCRGEEAFQKCDLSQVQILIVTIAQIILGLSGSIALLMFIVGGIMYLTSAGNPAKVSKGTKMITSAVIGLIIIFSAGVIIKFVLGTLTGDQGLAPEGTGGAPAQAESK